jgi:hypothetical protein
MKAVLAERLIRSTNSQSESTALWVIARKAYDGCRTVAYWAKTEWHNRIAHVTGSTPVRPAPSAKCWGTPIRRSLWVICQGCCTGPSSTCWLLQYEARRPIGL